jgi:hypothetical protein
MLLPGKKTIQTLVFLEKRKKQTARNRSQHKKPHSTKKTTCQKLKNPTCWHLPLIEQSRTITSARAIVPNA